MTLAALMLTDIDDVFLNTDEHAISVVYVSALVGEKNITAVMSEQNGGPEDRQHARTLTRHATFALTDDPDTGISQLNDQDYVLVEYQSVLQRWALSKIVDHVAGMWTIECVLSKLTDQGMKQGNAV